MSHRSASVSIILTTYNRLAYLQNAIRSVFEQTWGDWDLLVIDDGSTDGSLDWLSTLDDARVRICPRQHTGAVSVLRNLGIQNSLGEWVAFLDDDDAWYPQKLERQMALHAAHPEWRWSYTAVTRMDGAGAYVPPNPNKPWRPLAGRILLPLLTLDVTIALPSVVARRDLLKEANGFDESLAFSMDQDLWFRLANMAEAGVLDEPLTYVRNHEGNRTAYQPGVNIDFMKSYAKFAEGAPVHVQRICRRQQAYHGVRLARQWLSREEFEPAWHALFAALRLRPLYPWAWRTIAKTLVFQLTRQRSARSREVKG